ncbi:unnamed protein product [Heterotrigona itama]|uniref:Outer dynein arm-docking complex subunit 4 n=1 Tax=Heterotrigona itama TaxID=395501 RepID=A0A6V7H2P3_9HYME|nr:unnamed protein product [Heterotrigona itama]
MAVLARRGLTDDLEDLNDTRKTVENAENRARLRRDGQLAWKNNREYAQALHREADQLYRSGDYESALVLYHRAGNLYPRDSSHGAAARRTVATISCCNNPAKALRNFSSCSSGERLTIALCPETAAITANQRLNKSPEPASIHQVLAYFDDHKSYWKSLPSPGVCNTQLARTKMTSKQLNSLAEATLKNLEASFESGKLSAALKITQELLALSDGFQDPGRYQIAAYHYLSFIHVSMGRHDRAVRSASRLIRLSKSTENVAQVCRSLATLGKVHLSFGHLDAAAKAWQHLAKSLSKPIPVAWIRHEIGRCYLETGRYEKAVQMGFDCVDAATKANSSKWTLNGRLLIGQSLAKLGRFVESLEELQIAAKITEEEGDTPMLSYIRRLIDQVARAVRESVRSVEEAKPTTTTFSRKREATTERPGSKGDADKMPDLDRAEIVEIEKRKKTRKRGRRRRRRRRKKRVSSASSSSSSLLSVQQDDCQLKRENSSDVSLRSGNTATDGGFSELLEYEEQRDDMLNALRVIEELGKKDEVELLQMLRDMLLPTEEQRDFGDSGVPQRNEVATSLPSSPRKRHADPAPISN